MTGVIDGWIGYGSEPCYKYKGRLQSFNTLRERYLEDVLEKISIEYVCKHLDEKMDYKGREVTILDYLIETSIDKFIEDGDRHFKYRKNKEQIEQAIKVYGYSKEDLHSEAFRRVLRIKIKEDIENNLKLIREGREKEIRPISIDGRYGKKIYFYWHDLEDALRTIPAKAVDLDTIRRILKLNAEAYGIDPDKFCFDIGRRDALRKVEEQRKVSRKVGDESMDKPAKLYRVVHLDYDELQDFKFMGDDLTPNRPLVIDKDGRKTYADGDEYGVYMFDNLETGLDRNGYSDDKISLDEPFTVIKEHFGDQHAFNNGHVIVVYEVDTTGLDVRKPFLKPGISGHSDDELIVDSIPKKNYGLYRVIIERDLLHDAEIVDVSNPDNISEEIKQKMDARKKRLELFKRDYDNNRVLFSSGEPMRFYRDLYGENGIIYLDENNLDRNDASDLLKLMMLDAYRKDYPTVDIPLLYTLWSIRNKVTDMDSLTLALEEKKEVYKTRQGKTHEIYDKLNELTDKFMTMIDKKGDNKTNTNTDTNYDITYLVTGSKEDDFKVINSETNEEVTDFEVKASVLLDVYKKQLSSLEKVPNSDRLIESLKKYYEQAFPSYNLEARRISEIGNKTQDDKKNPQQIVDETTEKAKRDAKERAHEKPKTDDAKEPDVSSKYGLKDRFIIDNTTGEIYDQRRLSIYDKAINISRATGNVLDIEDETLVALRNQSVEAYAKTLKPTPQLEKLYGDKWREVLIEAYTKGWTIGMTSEIQKAGKEGLQQRSQDIAKIESGDTLEVSQREVSMEEMHYISSNFEVTGDDKVVFKGTQKEVMSERTKSAVQFAKTWEVMLGDKAYTKENQETYQFIMTTVRQDLRETGQIDTAKLQEEAAKRGESCSLITNTLVSTNIDMLESFARMQTPDSKQPEKSSKK